ncbi:PEP-CTERM sorting domain-containing protein [Granulicella sp. S190]|uniref:PEP-CTERM sorting domain-containing protein n=1 Tax=Granulicella sp. S190 TaxID=1747226 RepID=UPI00131AE2EF|nr:PEP-CTERM sorting domain-containing protein [Granulicella sp. S190]
MKLLARWFSASVALFAVAAFTCPKTALADSYTILDLGDANARSIYGMDTAGDVVIYGNGCGTFGPCYTTFIDGVASSHSESAPDMVYDDGTPCTSTPAGFNAAKKVCNSGYVGLGTLFNANGNPNGAYIGSGDDFQFLHSGSADQVFLNSVGDFTWTDGSGEEIYEAIDTTVSTVPEPGNLMLVGTGLLLFTAAVRRRALRKTQTHKIY